MITPAGKLWVIGVGPGDPELMTLKAVEALRRAETVYHAGPADGEGFALQIVRPFLRPNQSIRTIDLLMVRGREGWRERYAPAVELIAEDCRAGRNVAFITEGDPTLYSSASYLWQLLHERHPDIEFEVVPGVTSITAAAARAKTPLAQKDERLAILPATYHVPAISEVAKQFDNIVLVKLGETWPDCLESLKTKQTLYAERVTTAEEFITHDVEEMRRHGWAYFSLLLAKNRRIPISDPLALNAEVRLWVIGIGPGDFGQLTLAARQVLESVDAVVGYEAYLDLLKPLNLRAEWFPRPIGEERERAELALRLASEGRRVALVSSGDAGVYGMASLLLDQASGGRQSPGACHKPNIQILPGVTAATAAASLLGAPLGHDFACISLSDLLTPWELIEQRLDAAARADFVIVLYNPVSKRRTWQLPRACEILLRHRSPATPVGLVDNAYRPGQRVWHSSLGSLASEAGVTMTTTVIVGNSQTRTQGGWMITPRSV